MTTLFGIATRVMSAPAVTELTMPGNPGNPGKQRHSL